MSQEEVYTAAPVSQQFKNEGGTEYVSVENRKDLCACCHSNVVNFDTWWFGFFCPCVLIGSSHKMKKNGFTKKKEMCSGCCDNSCLGISLLFGVGPCVGAAFAVSCTRLHESSNDCDDYFQYLFCMPCRSCADYSSALAQVEQNKSAVY